VYARKCKVVKLSHNEKFGFLNKYHIQGSCKSKHAYGLIYDDNLIAVASFSRLRKGIGKTKQINNNEFELVRYASNISVIGGLDKLIHAFRKDIGIPISIISYADRRWSSTLDNIYEKTGWEFLGITKPNYWYITQNKKDRLHRYNLTKHRLIEMGGDPDLTEFENAINFGYDRIWDCGSIKYRKNVK
jgi:hypothetical protein